MYEQRAGKESTALAPSDALDQDNIVSEVGGIKENVKAPPDAKGLAG